MTSVIIMNLGSKTKEIPEWRLPTDVNKPSKQWLSWGQKNLDKNLGMWLSNNELRKYIINCYKARDLSVTSHERKLPCFTFES